jgi:hypothetical protein
LNRAVGALGGTEQARTSATPGLGRLRGQERGPAFADAPEQVLREPYVALEQVEGAARPLPSNSTLPNRDACAVTDAALVDRWPVPKATEAVVRLAAATTSAASRSVLRSVGLLLLGLTVHQSVACSSASRIASGSERVV